MAVVSAVTRASIFGQPGQVERVQVVTPWGIPTLCHALIAPLFLAACAEAARSGWNPLRIDSYNPRPIRGEDGSQLSEWSLHAWCLAWDFFATPPGVAPPGGVWTPDNGVPREFAECFERYGFRWGGRWTDRPDVPHIEWAGGRPPAVQPQEDDMPLNDDDKRWIRSQLGVDSDLTKPVSLVGSVSDAVKNITGVLIPGDNLLGHLQTDMKNVVAGIDIDIDEAAIASAVAQLVNRTTIAKLSDDDFARIAKEVADEQHRRQAG